MSAIGSGGGDIISSVLGGVASIANAAAGSYSAYLQNQVQTKQIDAATAAQQFQEKQQAQLAQQQASQDQQLFENQNTLQQELLDLQIPGLTGVSSQSLFSSSNNTIAGGNETDVMLLVGLFAVLLLVLTIK